MSRAACVSCVCRGRSVPCVYVVLWRVCCVCGGTRDVADVGSVMGTSQLPRCRRCSGSGGCAEQAGEPDESELAM